MKSKNIKALTSIVVFGLATNASAATLFFEDFEGVTAPAAPAAANWQVTSNITTGKDSTSFATTTNYAISAGNKHSLFTKNLDFSELLTVTSFQFNDKSPSRASTALSFGLKTAGNGGFDVVGRSAFQLILERGAIATGLSTSLAAAPATPVYYTPGVSNTLSFAFNDTLATASYLGADGVTRSLEVNQASVYLNNSWVGIYNGGTAIPGSVAFHQFTNGTFGRFFIDNVGVDSVESIPEPSAVALLALAGLGVFARRRR